MIEDEGGPAVIRRTIHGVFEGKCGTVAADNLQRTPEPSWFGQKKLY